MLQCHNLLVAVCLHFTAQDTHRVGSCHRASPTNAAATSKMRRLRAMWKSLVTTDSRLQPCTPAFSEHLL